MCLWNPRFHDPGHSAPAEALARIEGGAVAQTLAIVVRSVSGEEYDRIVEYELGPMPAPLEDFTTQTEFLDDEVPF